MIGKNFRMVFCIEYQYIRLFYHSQEGGNLGYFPGSLLNLGITYKAKGKYCTRKPVRSHQNWIWQRGFSLFYSESE
jgi:hypothetical protein